MGKFGVCSVTFRALSPEDVLKIARQNGVFSVEWGGDVHVPPDNLRNAEAVKRLTAQYGRKCFSYGSYFRCLDSGAFEQISLCAEALGAGIIRVWAGNRDAEYFTDVEYENLVTTVRECAVIAVRRDQTIAFEYHHATFCNRAENVVRLLNDIGEDNVKTYWQPMYWQSVPFERQESENLRSILLLRDWIVNVHVYQWRGTERVALAEGLNEWRRYIDTLGDVGYFLEFVRGDSVSSFQEDCVTMERILKKEPCD